MVLNLNFFISDTHVHRIMRRTGVGVALLFATQAQAARPMVNDDARITDVNSCQVESWVRTRHVHTEYWILPACNVTGNLEWTLGAGYAHDTALDEVAQAKMILKPLVEDGWGIGLTFGATRHTQKDKEGSDGYVNVPVSILAHGERIALHFNVGALQENEGRKNHATWGVGTEVRLAERTWGIAEIFSQDRETPFQQIGVRHWLWVDRVQIDVAYGSRFGVKGTSDTRWFSAGLRFLGDALLR